MADKSKRTPENCKLHSQKRTLPTNCDREKEKSPYETENRKSKKRKINSKFCKKDYSFSDLHRKMEEYNLEISDLPGNSRKTM